MILFLSIVTLAFANIEFYITYKSSCPPGRPIVSYINKNENINWDEIDCCDQLKKFYPIEKCQFLFKELKNMSSELLIDSVDEFYIQYKGFELLRITNVQSNYGSCAAIDAENYQIPTNNPQKNTDLILHALIIAVVVLFINLACARGC